MAEAALQLFEAFSASLKPMRPYAEAITVFKFPELRQRFEDVANAGAPVPADVLIYLTAMFAAYPLSLVFAAIPSSLPVLRHLFSLVTGVVLAQFVFGYEWVHCLFCGAVVYAIVALTARIRAFDSCRHLIVFTFMLTYMTVAHLLRLYHDYMGWSLDITGPLMLLTIKLTSFGYNYYDGVTAKPLRPDADERVKRVYAERQARALTALPDPLEFFGWVFNYASFFAGPAFELREYLNTVNRPASVSAKLRSRILPVIVKLFQGVFFMALNAVGSAHYPFLVGSAPNIEVNPNLLTQPTLLHTAAIALFSLLFVRAKYYAAWKVSEGAAVLAGFGHQAATPRSAENWDGVSNVDVLGFEFADNVSNGSKAWNQRTQSWLENYVYKRAPPAIAMNLTYFISAFWHGFYPGYYMFFLSVPLVQNLSKAVRIKLRPMTLTEDGKPKSWKVVYDLVGRVCTHVSMNYLASAFVALGWYNALAIWGAYRWSIHILSAVGLLLISFVPGPKKAKTA